MPDPRPEQDTDALGLAAFTDFIEADDVSGVLGAIDLEMKESGFGGIDIADFTDFNKTGEFTEEGTHTFAVEARHLFQATNVMRLIAQVGSRQEATVKLTIFRDRLKLASANKVAFAENLIKLATPSNVEDGHEIAFVFDGNILAAIAKNLSAGGVISFNYNATTRVLSIQEGSTTLNLTTKTSVDFAEFHKQIGQPVEVGKFDPVAMRSALLYLELFAYKDDSQRSMGVVNVDGAVPVEGEGRVYGGSHNGIAIYESPGLANIRLRIPNSAIKAIQRIVSRMHPEESHMFTAGHFVIFRDQNLYLGFELTEYEFPPVDEVIAQPGIDRISVTREHLLNSLIKLSVVSANPDTTIRLTISGTGQAALLSLRILDATGKASVDRIGVLRDLKYKNEMSFDVTLYILKRTLEHFKTENVILEPTDISVLIRDEGEGFRAITVVTIMTEAVQRDVAAAKAIAKKEGVAKATGVGPKDMEELAATDDDGDRLLEEVN